MADLKIDTGSVQSTAQNLKAELEAFKYDILNQQEMYQDVLKHQLYNQINEKINEINQIFHHIQDQCRREVFDVRFELYKQELYEKRKEKEYKRRIWLQGRKRRK